MQRCPATDTITVEGQPIELRCVYWSDDPGGRHSGDHLVHAPAVMDDHTWTNDHPLPGE
jgi:hypothetical protein